MSELAKLKITPEASEAFDVMFNPKEYTITKSTPWKHHDIQGLDAPTLEFTSGDPYRIQFELFIDCYESGDGRAGDGGRSRFATERLSLLSTRTREGSPVGDRER